jgi:hypothetical protein
VTGYELFYGIIFIEREGILFVASGTGFCKMGNQNVLFGIKRREKEGSYWIVSSTLNTEGGALPPLSMWCSLKE